MSSIAIYQDRNNLFPSLPSYEGLPAEMKKEVEKATYVETLKEQCLLEKREEAFDLNYYKNGWFEGLAKNSRRIYDNALQNFLNYSNNKVLSITAVDADKFIPYLKSFLPSESSVRSYYRGISSFFSYLERNAIINRNPFRGCKIKLNTKPKDKYVPSDEEIIAVETYALERYSTETFIKLRMGIHLMQHYGVRVDFLNNVKLEGNTLVSVSKGKDYVVELDNEEDVEYYSRHEEILNSLNSNSISTWFNTCVKHLYEEGVIGGKFSPHCLRHYFATKFYNEYEGSGDRIYELMLLLNHGSINVTLTYLRSLGLIKEK